MTEPDGRFRVRSPVMVNGFDGSGLAGLPASTRELIARREAALGGAYRLFYDQPVEFVARRGGVPVRPGRASRTSTPTTTCRRSGTRTRR